MADVAVEVDAFASALEDIFDDIRAVSEDDLKASVEDGAKESKEQWSDGAPQRTGKYAKSIRYRVDASGDKPKATVYSTMPGLPHLLEKGHATIGGGRVAARPHVAPAAEAGFDRAMESLGQRLEANL